MADLGPLCLAFLRLAWLPLVAKEIKEIDGREDKLGLASTFQTSASSHLLDILLAKSHHRVKIRFNGGRSAP